MEKVEIYVRFANDCDYYGKIMVDPNNIKDPQVFDKEVFVTIDNLRVAIPRMEWDRIAKIKEEEDV
jgi:hypothetical protein